MKRSMILLASLILAISLAGIAFAEESNITSSDKDSISADSASRYNNTITITNVTKLPNPASIYCEKQGYSSEARKESTGKEYKVCVFPDGKECSELEFLRGKCGREYVGITKEKLMETIAIGTNKKLEERMCKEGCSFEVDDKKITIKELSDKRKEIIAEKINARTGLNLTVENVDDQLMLRAYLSNGRWALIKYMPDRAANKALETLQAKCLERNCTLELKEVKTNGKENLVYEMNTDKDAKLLAIFATKMPLKAQIDAETGKVIATKKPWWAFLATEKNEK